MEIHFEIDKADIYKEVAMTTSYTGAKMDEDANAYERIFTTDEDQQQLERFWQEAESEMCNELIRLIAREEMNGGRLEVSLNVSSAFDKALEPSMGKSLRSYFIQSISAKWFVFTNKKEAGAYAAAATMHLDDVKRKAMYKRQPMRPRYD